MEGAFYCYQSYILLIISIKLLSAYICWVTSRYYRILSGPLFFGECRGSGLNHTHKYVQNTNAKSLSNKR